MRPATRPLVLVALAACVGDPPKTQDNHLSDKLSQAAQPAGPGGTISFREFSDYQRAFVERYPGINQGAYLSVHAVRRLLATENAHRIRASYGVNHHELEAMLAPVDSDGAIDPFAIEIGEPCSPCILRPQATEASGPPLQAPFVHSADRRTSYAEFEAHRAAYKQRYPDLNDAVVFATATFERLLSVKGVAVVGVHFGIEQGKLQVMYVPIDADHQPILFDDQGASTVENRGGLCPPNCDD